MGMASGERLPATEGGVGHTRCAYLTLYLPFPCLHGRDRTLTHWGNIRVFNETNDVMHPSREGS